MTKIISTKLLNVFQAHRDKSFLFVRQLGNFGDDLLIMGAEKVAQRASCDFRSINFREYQAETDCEEEVIYIHGGGNYNDIWAGASISALAKALKEEKATVILGPQTFMLDEKFLTTCFFDVLETRRCREVFIFTREKTSYEALKRNTPKEVHLDFDHDTALNVTKDDVYAPDIEEEYRLYAIRDDEESSELREINPFALKVDPTAFCRDFPDWVRLHARASHVITNRLHSAIVGYILGKMVILLPGSYHKNRSVWEFSLKERGVEWQTNLIEPKILRWFNRNALYRKVVSSYKWRHLIPWFHGVHRGKRINS